MLFNPNINNEFSYAAHADVEYTPSERNLFVLSLGNSYRVASIEERFKYIDQAGTLRVGNPDLKPEKGIFSNLNYTLKGNRLFFKTDVFANYLFDLIAEKAGTYNNGTTQVAALVNTNISRALFMGVETELSWIISKQFSLNSGFSYVNARDLKDNSFIPQIPPARGEIALNYRQDKMFDVTLMAVAAASQNNIAAGETATKGYVVFNCNAVSAPVKFGKSSVVFLAGIENILNTAYYNHLSTTRGINRLEPGRNIFAKIKLGW